MTKTQHGNHHNGAGGFAFLVRKSKPNQSESLLSSAVVGTILPNSQAQTVEVGISI